MFLSPNLMLSLFIPLTIGLTKSQVFTYYPGKLWHNLHYTFFSLFDLLSHSTYNVTLTLNFMLELGFCLVGFACMFWHLFTIDETHTIMNMKIYKPFK